MQTYISLLRGINVSGKNKIKMEDLRALYEFLGFTDVKSYIQSGNVIFKAPRGSNLKLSTRISDGIKEKFGFDIPVLVKTEEELENIIKNLPFEVPDEDKDKRLFVTFLSEEPKEFPKAVIEKAKAPGDKIRLVGTEIYLYTPDGYGKSKLSNNFLEKKLDVVATSRGWRSVNEILKIE